MTRYETDAPLARDAADALDRAEAALSAAGFRIADRPRDGLVAEGPGLRSTNQNPLLGATRIELTAGGRTLRAAAEMGGVDWMRRFVTWFPQALGLGIGLIGVAALWPAGNWRATRAVVIASAATTLPWIVIGPLVGRWIRGRSEAAVDALLHNAGGRPAAG